MKKIFLTVLMLATFILGGCGSQAENEPQNESQAKAKEENQPKQETQAEAAPAQVVKGDLKISMLNVGQGDAILIQTGKQTILIDTSDTDERDLLVNELEKLSVTKIDKLILTHPHADHIGNAKVLINPSSKELKANPYLEKISVAEVYDNGITSTSPLYKSYTKAIENVGITLTALKVGDTLDYTWRDDPYNTYTNLGLPPGPVCNPNEVAIEAALNPDTSQGYFFFCADMCNGGTVFARTYAEHEYNIQHYYLACAN